MQKVGVSNAEVKQAIRSQVLTVFFLPLVVAILHVVMAFPMMAWISAALNLRNRVLFAGCLTGTALVSFIY